MNEDIFIKVIQQQALENAEQKVLIAQLEARIKGIIEEQKDNDKRLEEIQEKE